MITLRKPLPSRNILLAILLLDYLGDKIAKMSLALEGCLIEVVRITHDLFSNSVIYAGQYTDTPSFEGSPRLRHC